MMQFKYRAALLLPALLLAGCGLSDPTEPEDGGHALDLSHWDAEDEKIVSGDCMWRREKSGWHYSIGHCEEMLPSEEMTGVFVTGHEQRSYIPEARKIPDPYDARLSLAELEVDQAKLDRKTGAVPRDGYPAAYLLTFVGRRTRHPLHVDCYGDPHFVFIADQLISARHLGKVARWTMEEALKRRPLPNGPVKRLHPGRWGELEAQADEHCNR